MSSEEGFRFADEIVDLCRLPRLPHEVLALELNERQAFYFDLSFIRGAKEFRLYEFSKAQGSMGDKDILGTGGIQALAVLDLKRS